MERSRRTKSLRTNFVKFTKQSTSDLESTFTLHTGSSLHGVHDVLVVRGGGGWDTNNKEPVSWVLTFHLLHPPLPCISIPVHLPTPPSPKQAFRRQHPWLLRAGVPHATHSPWGQGNHIFQRARSVARPVPSPTSAPSPPAANVGFVFRSLSVRGHALFHLLLLTATHTARSHAS